MFEVIVIVVYRSLKCYFNQSEKFRKQLISKLQWHCVGSTDFTLIQISNSNWKHISSFWLLKMNSKERYVFLMPNNKTFPANNLDHFIEIEKTIFQRINQIWGNWLSSHLFHFLHQICLNLEGFYWKKTPQMFELLKLFVITIGIILNSFEIFLILNSCSFKSWQSQSHLFFIKIIFAYIIKLPFLTISI